jgi:N utilization substance protein A
MGQRLKVYLLEVARTNRGPRVIVSRSHPDLLRRLFELEVPEVYNGIVEIKSIAREAGFRSKIAVATSQDGIDPVGCCVGLRGIRIQNIVNELNGEKIDVVMWHPDQSILIANALSPAKVLGVELNNSEQIATVVIPDRQLSLAIGKEGQNVRLAAKLTGWHIDIKSASVAEAQRAAEAQLVTEVEKETVTGVEIPSVEPDTMEPFLLPGEEEPAEPTTVLEAEPVPIAVPFEPETIEEKPQLRFAEDISVSKPIKTDTKQKKKKKGVQDKTAEDGIKLKKRRRAQDVLVDEEEY